MICTISSFGQSINFVESVEYDASQNRFFYSNSSSILARASDGQLSFFSNQEANAGMEVMGDYLFAIDGGTIRGFDLVTEDQVMSINIPGAGFLNGLTNDGVSTLYTTDFSNNRIHKIDVSDFANPTQEIIVSNTGSTPNGIIYDGDNNRLIFVDWAGSAKIKAVDLVDNSVSTIITTNVGSIDGIDDDNDGNYYISSWSPARITKYDSDFANPEIISTPFINNPADICYAKEIDTLAIPVGSNGVVFVGFGVDTMATSITKLELEELEFNVYPNPVNDHSIIQFELKKSGRMNLSIYSSEGRLVKTLIAEQLPHGQHKISFSGINIPSGMYFLAVEKHGKRNSVPIIVE